MFKKLVSCSSVLSILSMDVAYGFNPSKEEEKESSSRPSSPPPLLESKEQLESSKAPQKPVDTEELRKAFQSSNNSQEKVEIFKKIPQQANIRKVALKSALQLISSSETSREIQLETLHSLASTHMGLGSQTPDLEKKPFLSFVLSFLSDNKLPVGERADLFPLLDSEHLLKFAKSLLSETSNPEDIIKIITGLRGGDEEDKLRIKYVVEIANTSTNSKKLRENALLQIPYDKCEPQLRKQLDETLFSFIDDEEIAFETRANFLYFLEQQIPVKILLNLLDTEKKNIENFRYPIVLAYAVSHPMPETQEKIEELIFKFPNTLNYSTLSWLKTYLEKAEKTKKTEFIRKLNQCFFPSESMLPKDKGQKVDSVVMLGLANLILMETSNSDLAEPVEEFLKQVIDAYKFEEYDSDSSSASDDEVYINADIYKVCDAILQHSKNQKLRQDTLDWIIKVSEKNTHSCGFGKQSRFIRVLLKQEDKEIYEKGIDIVRSKLNVVDPKRSDVQEGLGVLFKALRNRKRGEKEQQQILDLLKPTVQEFFSHHSLKDEISDTENEEEGSEISSDSRVSSDRRHEFRIIQLFLTASDQDLQKQAYEYMLNILKYEDICEEYIHERAVDSIIWAFGDDHPFSQEAIQLMSGRDHSENPNSIFAIHRQLLEKVKESVKHNQVPTPPINGRRLQLNLKSLNAPQKTREVFFVKHKDFIQLVEQLADEVNKSKENQEKKESSQPYEGAYGTFLSQMGSLTTDYLIGKAKEPFFGFLLDGDNAFSPDKNPSELSLSFRNILKAAQKKDKQSSPQMLSAASQLILQLLVNVLTCPTGREGGIRNTELLIKELPILSEEDIEKKVIDLATEFILEDLRNDRIRFLNGEGPVIKSLLSREQENEKHQIVEPLHQEKYLLSLLGGEIGIRSKEARIPFDTNGTAILENLRRLSKQEALDTLYQFHTPENVIKKYLDKFNNRDFKIVKTGPRPEDEKDVSYGVIRNLIDPKMLKDTKYVNFVDNDPEDDLIFEAPWTKLLIAEVLLRLGILEEVKPQHYSLPKRWFIKASEFPGVNEGIAFGELFFKNADGFNSNT